MITVHLVGNAHLDPVWLWRWPAGVGEAISTCRSAAERLKEYSEFVFTRSDMWVYEQIEKLAPELFERIRGYAKAGRWQIVGGWYIQPDCNLPTAISFRKHISISKAYFQEKLGVDVTVGYNVDSFGHNAMIPSFLKEAGYDSYVMMRPMAHEKELPSALFRWRAPDGAEVMVWRIVRSYATRQEDLTEHVQTSLDAADPDIGHVMCFYGVGDHGGGPTKLQIEWLMKHRDAFPGARLVFSHPRAFFDAVRPYAEQLPVVADELQYHAVGCYTVVHEFKRQMRRAEHGLVSAERAIEAFPGESPADAPDRLTEAWKKTLFNQFHDIYAGTSLKSAYEDARDQLGSARDAADTILHNTLFRRMRHLPKDRWQRIVAFNASDHQFGGYLQHEPWLEWGSFGGWLADEKGNRVPYQRIQHESVTGIGSKKRLIWPAEIAPGGERVYQLRTDEAPPLPESDLRVNDASISNQFWLINPGKGKYLLDVQRVSDRAQLLDADGLRLVVQHDNSDTWSHSIDGFREPVIDEFELRHVSVEETGPVRAAIRIEAVYRESRLTLWVRLHANAPGVELHLCLDWRQRLQIAKLAMPFGATIKNRLDGIPGGAVPRPQNGQEFPIMDWTSVRSEDGSTLGIVCPDCSGLDGTDNSLRFTLLRSPAYAWHDPAKLEADTFYHWADQGEHSFRFLIAGNVPTESLKTLAISEHRPPVCLDWTNGMP